MSIATRAIRETPIAIVDTETTGLYPGGDRVIEIAVVRSEPGEDPKLVVDTLINPRRPVSATEIHGITDEDVADAPPFAGISARANAKGFGRSLNWVASRATSSSAASPTPSSGSVRLAPTSR